MKNDSKVIEYRSKSWRLEAGGVTKWGDNSEVNYSTYLDWLQKQGVLKEKVETKDVITNDLISDINTFDVAALEAEAKAAK